MLRRVQQPHVRPPVADRQLPRCQDPLGAQLLLQRPAHHAPTEDREEHRQREDPLLLRRHVGAMRPPELSGTRSGEGALDQIGGWHGRGIASGGVHRSAPMASYQSGPAQKPRHPVMPARHPSCRQLRVHPQGPVGSPAGLMNPPNLLSQLGVGAGASGGLALPPRPLPAGGDSQHPAHAAHRMMGLLALHQLVDPHRIASVSRAKTGSPTGGWPRLFARSRVLPAQSGLRVASAGAPPGPPWLARHGVSPRPGLPA